jgi:hypothetical protein
MTARKQLGGASAPFISAQDVDDEVYATALANAKRMLAYFDSDEFKDGERLGKELLRIGDMGPQEATKHLEAHPPTPMAIAWLIMEARRLGASATASGNASRRNQEERQLVQDAWRNRPDPGQGKAAFARQWSALLKKQTGAIVTARQIETRWLKGM